MTIEMTPLTRTFSYNGVTLPDPGPGMTLDEVRDVLSAAYPELVSASIEGPVAKGDKLEYTFRKAVGAKG